MQQYFKLINSQMHGLPGGKVESESFSHDFRLPDCYDIQQFREQATVTEKGQSLLVSSQRCQKFPDKVLFYIFYNMPHDRGQLSAYNELVSRQWIYLQKQMRWIKPNPAGLKKDTKKKITKSKRDNESTTRTAIVFNPQLWKEEVVTLHED